jgi:DNA-binding response OmpR family regulator
VSALAVEFVAGGGPGDDEPAPPRHAREGISSGGEAGEEAGSGLRVLLVEDDRAMRLLCTVNLELGGFAVVSATNGADGVERARAEPFDLVLLDVMLPDLGGFEVAEQLSRDARTASLPIVFLSARASELDIERGRSAGGIDYIVKPFDPLGLPERIREDLDEHSRTGTAGVWRLRFGQRHG